VHIERLDLTGFRCFGPDPVGIALDEGLTALIGANGAGKTAALEALMRLFGVTQQQRNVRVRDFHIPVDEDHDDPPLTRTLAVDVVLAFPELDRDNGNTDAVPEFFVHMAANEAGEMKCRIRLDATWESDGSVEGAIAETRRVIRTLEEDFTEEDTHDLSPSDRSRIQVVYVPAVRDGAQHLTAFLRGRLWRAARWSDTLRDDVRAATDELNVAFASEPAVAVVKEALASRWQELHSGGTDAEPEFRPVNREFAQFVEKADLFFEPTEAGSSRRATDLSDGQRSLLHIALTAATLDIEGEIAAGAKEAEFDETRLRLPALTILAVEEPENSLSPFFLSRIVGQMLDIADSRRAQALVSSHSPSVLGRIDPESVRHFRIRVDTAVVNSITLPAERQEAAKYVREAVRTFPELYFAKFAVLGEGSSEEIVLPIIAEARGIPIDRSFIAVVPLGGRHVNHLWRLLNQLSIPHATLLDLDWGRHGAGIERVKAVHGELAKLGIEAVAHGDTTAEWDITAIDADNVDAWVEMLREYNVYFCDPLDLDWDLLRSFYDDYTALEPGARGPSGKDASEAVLGDRGDASYYGEYAEELRWYRYLFLGRSKPSTHLRVLTGIELERLRDDAPEVLASLIDKIKESIG